MRNSFVPRCTGSVVDSDHCEYISCLCGYRGRAVPMRQHMACPRRSGVTFHVEAGVVPCSVLTATRSMAYLPMRPLCATRATASAQTCTCMSNHATTHVVVVVVLCAGVGDRPGDSQRVHVREPWRREDRRAVLRLSPLRRGEVDRRRPRPKLRQDHRHPLRRGDRP